MEKEILGFRDNKKIKRGSQITIYQYRQAVPNLQGDQGRYR
jgi:hypothetical protein